MDILINVSKQRLKLATNLKKYVSGSQEFVRFVFGLNSYWRDLLTFAQFAQNGNTYNRYLDDENAVYLPAEIEAGECTLTLFGSGNNVIATTNYLTLTIDENILVSDATSTEISESLYEQLVDMVRSVSNGTAVVDAKNKMIDKNKIYVYIGSETGMTNGDWYYWNGTVWTSGGVWNAVAVETDKTLSVENKAADGKAAGSLVEVGSTQPTSTANKIWIDPTDEEVEIPEMSDLNAVDAKVDNLKSALNKKLTNEEIEWISGRVIRYDEGVTNLSSSFKASRPILIPVGAELLEFVMPCYTSSSGQQTKYGLAFYDDNMDYVSGIQMPVAPQSGNTAKVLTVSIPADVAYFRTTWYDDSYAGYTYDGDFYVSYKTQVIPTIKIVDSMWTSNMAVRYDTGATSSSTSFKLSSFVQVTDMLFKITIPCYTSTSGAQTSYGLAFYNENMEYISGVRMPVAPQAGNTAEVISVTAPPNAVYFRTTWYNDSYTGYTYDGNFYYTSTDYDTYLMQKSTDTKNAGKYLVVESDGKIGFSGYMPPVPTSAEEITVILGQEEVNCFYGLTSAGLVESNLFGVTSYIDCLGTETINVKMPIITSGQSTVGLAFYDGTKTQLSFIDSNIGSANGAEIRTITVPSRATYFRATYWNYDQAQTYGEWYCSFITAQYGYGKYRPYQSGYIFFSPKVNNAVNQYWETAFDTEMDEEYKETTGVLLLPTSYTPEGKPTPIIMYFHGHSHYVYYDHWGNTDTFRTQKAQWAAQGFAVMDCNGARNNNKTGGFTSGGSLQYSDGYHKCFEYIKQHYNVEDRCHVICVSAGGIPGINYSYWYNDIKSLQMLSAWTDLKKNSYENGQTASMIEYLACDFTDGYAATADKTIGFDPTLRIMTIDGIKYLPQGKVPMKAFLGSTEQNNHIWNALQNYITALRNAGQSVSLRIVDGATHADICSGDNLALNTEYANFCKGV